MIEVRTKKPRLSINLDGTIAATFECSRSDLPAFEGLSEKDLVLTVKEYRPKRTLTQNAYLWVILGEMAAAMKTDKTTLYRQYIRDFGVYEVFPIKREAVEAFTDKWERSGLGYFCEDLGESKMDGFAKIVAYFGSSTYTTAEMARVIDAVVQDAEEIGVQTMSADEWKSLEN